MHFAEAGSTALPELDPVLRAPWDKVIVPAHWASVDGVELGHEVQRSRKRVERLGEVVRDDVTVVDTAQYLMVNGPIGELRIDDLGALRGQSRVQIRVVRPSALPPIEDADGSIAIDGRSIPFVMTGGRHVGVAGASWAVTFHDGDADVMIAGMDIEEVPVDWVRVDAHPFRHALLRKLGRID